MSTIGNWCLFIHSAAAICTAVFQVVVRNHDRLNVFSRAATRYHPQEARHSWQQGSRQQRSIRVSLLLPNQDYRQDLLLKVGVHTIRRHRQTLRLLGVHVNDRDSISAYLWKAGVFSVKSVPHLSLVCLYALAPPPTKRGTVNCNNIPPYNLVRGTVNLRLASRAVATWSLAAVPLYSLSQHLVSRLPPLLTNKALLGPGGEITACVCLPTCSRPGEPTAWDARP